MRIIALLAVVVQIGSAATIPSLQPRVLLPDEALPDSFWLSAPIVAVVNVKAADFVGPEIEITPTNTLAVRLVKVEFQLENVLRGYLPADSTRFYFFTNTPRLNSYPTPLSWFEPGHRYIVFLRVDGDVLRSLMDLSGPAIEINSGRHDQIPAQPSKPDPGLDIAYVALMPASGHDGEFAPYIRDAERVARRFAGPSQAAALLRKLLLNPDESIRSQACLVLAQAYLYRDECLVKLATSGDPAIRQNAVTLNRGKEANDRMWIKILREDPTSLTATGFVADLAGDLEQFTYDASDGVRRQACTTLRRIFPSRLFPNCSSESPAK